MRLAEPDPRLLPHLEPGEPVLWESWPEFRGLLPVSTHVLLTMVCLSVAIGVSLLLLLPEPTGTTVWMSATVAVPMLLAPLVAPLVYRRDARRTVYALTDRRTLEVRGSRLVRADGLRAVDEIRVEGRGPRHGLVYWRRERRTSRGGRRRRTTETLIGFDGVPQPDAVAAVIAEWRDAALSAAAPRAEVFVQAVQSGQLPEGPPVGGVRRIANPSLGFAICAPVDWLAEVTRSESTQGGPITDFHGIWRPFDPAGEAWTALRLVPPGGAEIQVTAGDGPPTTFERASDATWAHEYKARRISAQADLQIGPWRGFDVVHDLRDASLSGIRLDSTHLRQRQIWLDLGGRHLFVRSAAPITEHGLLQALDAVACTLRPA